MEAHCDNLSLRLICIRPLLHEDFFYTKCKRFEQADQAVAKIFQAWNLLPKLQAKAFELTRVPYQGVPLPRLVSAFKLLSLGIPLPFTSVVLEPNSII